jgi:transporter family protein
VLSSTLFPYPPLFRSLYWHRAQPLPLALNVYGLLSGAALALGVLFYYFALAGGRVSIIVRLTATYPVVAALLGVAILGERPSLAQWIGIILIIMGAVLLFSSPLKSATR